MMRSLGCSHPAAQHRQAKASTFSIASHHGRAGPHSRRHAALITCSLPPVMINSCTGRMGHAAAEAIVRAGLQLVPFTFTGFSSAVAVVNVGVSGTPVEVVGRERRQQVMEQVKRKFPGLVIVDYTLPSCLNENAQFYLRNRIPFVMGTTGGDPLRLVNDIEQGGVDAVVAPQMGKQVAAFQAMMAMMADSFPGVFTGHTLQVQESHQRNKVDVSGTARAVVRSFQKMGIDFAESKIDKVRDRARQLSIGVPEEALRGHAFHTYSVLSPDGTCELLFRHDVVDRSTYAEGTVDAVLFLAKQAELRRKLSPAEAAVGRVYGMSDVLAAGALRDQLPKAQELTAA